MHLSLNPEVDFGGTGFSVAKAIEANRLVSGHGFSAPNRGLSDGLQPCDREYTSARPRKTRGLKALPGSVVCGTASSRALTRALSFGFEVKPAATGLRATSSIPKIPKSTSEGLDSPEVSSTAFRTLVGLLRASFTLAGHRRPRSVVRADETVRLPGGGQTLRPAADARVGLARTVRPWPLPSAGETCASRADLGICPTCARSSPERPCRGMVEIALVARGDEKYGPEDSGPGRPGRPVPRGHGGADPSSPRATKRSSRRYLWEPPVDDVVKPRSAFAGGVGALSRPRPT